MYDRKIKIDFYVVVRQRVNIIEDQRVIEWSNDLLGEILILSNEEIAISRIFDHNEVDKIIDTERQQPSWSLFKSTILKFSTKKDINNNDNSFIKNLTNSLLENTYIANLHKRIMDYITCSNIVRPGILSVDKFYIYKNDEFFRIVNMFDCENIIQIFSFEKNLSLYEKQFKLSDVILWLNKLPLNNGISTNSLGRAIGALNQLLYTNLNEASAIVWASLALEALLCPDKNSKKRQEIHEKAEILFPHLQTQKNNFKKMYDSRSDFLHGSKDFLVYPFYSAVIIDVSKNKKNEENEQTHFDNALSLLFEVIQFMVASSRYELNFKYTWVLG